MKTLTLAAALAAATALATPAFAAGSGDATQAGAQGGAQLQTEDKAAGMSGERMEEAEVRELQQALKDAGHDVEVDGRWGDGTAQALRDFQEQEGLAASGELDSETLTALGLDLGTGINEGVPQTAEGPDKEPMPTEKPATGNIDGTTTGGSDSGSAN